MPDALLWQANAAAEKGKTDKAIVYLKQYLEFRPDDHDTAVRLADLMVDRAISSKDLTNAHFLYERVLREAPHRVDVGRKLVALSLRLGRHGDALSHAERLLKDAPNDGELLAQVAECLVAQNRPLEARPMFEQAITHRPGQRPSLRPLRAICWSRHFNKPKDAGAILDRMVRANPAGRGVPGPRAVSEAGEPARRLHARPRPGVAARPGERRGPVLSAEVLQGRGEIRRARATLQEVVTLYPRYSHGYRALSWLELLSGNEADAASDAGTRRGGHPDSPELLTPLADLWVDQGYLDRVESVIQKLEARKDAATRVSYLRGRLLMKQGKWNDALAVLDGLRTEATAMPGLATQLNVLVANCHERRGDRDAQIEALKRAGNRPASSRRPRRAGQLLSERGSIRGRAQGVPGGPQVALRGGGRASHLCAVAAVVGSRSTAPPPEEWTAIGSLLTKVREQNKLAIEPAVVLAEWRACPRRL